MPIDSRDRQTDDGRDGLAPGINLPTTSPKLFLTIDNSSSSSSMLLATVWTITAEGSVSGDVVTGVTLWPCTSMVCMRSGAVSIGVVFVVLVGDTITDFRYYAYVQYYHSRWPNRMLQY